MFGILLTGCGNSQAEDVVGTYTGTSGSVMVIGEDNNVSLDNGESVSPGIWSIEDGVIYIRDRQGDSDIPRANIMAELPKGEITSLTFVQAEDEDRYENIDDDDIANNPLFTKDEDGNVDKDDYVNYLKMFNVGDWDTEVFIKSK